MQLAIYARTSDTNGDADSIENQVEACRAWAAANGHVIVDVFEDDGLSGKLSIAERPGLTSAVALIEAGEAGGLIVHRLDRIARALHVQEAVLATIWEAGARPFEAVSGEIPEDDPDDPMRRFVRQVRGAVHELERGIIVARLAGGKRRAAAQGRYIGGPRLHRKYGFDLIDGEYVERPEEQAVIARMRELREARRSLREIAARLTAEGIAPPSGDVWFPNTVSRILRREERRAAVA